MIDSGGLQLALRALALPCVVCTTGSTSLGATAAGYTRAAGSFETDGFYAGMEVAPTGYVANTATRLIREVSPTLLTIDGGCTVETAASGRTLAVGIPEKRGWENDAVTPTPKRHFLEEEFVPATSDVLTFPASSGLVEETGLYVLRWGFIAGYGAVGQRKCVDALIRCYAPGRTLVSSTMSAKVRSRPNGPTAGQPLRRDDWSVITVRIPWRAYTRNEALV